MKKKTLSLFEELESLHIKRDSQYLIESRASNIITSAVNLIKLINETYNDEQADDLTRKLLNSIRTANVDKFARGLSRINKERQ